MRDLDDEDDSMAANPEPARRDLGYASTLEPRRKKPSDKNGHWGVAWVEGKPADDAPSPKTCRDCNEPVAILHSISPEIRRTHCGACAGRINRARMEGR